MVIRLLGLGLVLGLAAYGQAASAADAGPDPAVLAKGKATFQLTCVTCHDITGKLNKVGPSLAGLKGRKAGSAEGFAYTPAMKNSGIVWTAETLDAYLAAPEKTVPGTNMLIMPVANVEERAALIQFLLQH